MPWLRNEGLRILDRVGSGLDVRPPKGLTVGRCRKRAKRAAPTPLPPPESTDGNAGQRHAGSGGTPASEAAGRARLPVAVDGTFGR
jgi:hypothetical protein